MSGHTKSCGCTKEGKKTHGQSKHPLYRIWDAIRYRCKSPKAISYPNYGGRGITICHEWVDNFENFFNWALENGWKEGLQIDRINNDGNYEPGNCTWSTVKEQARNRRSTRYIKIDGTEMKVIEAFEKGIITKKWYYYHNKPKEISLGDITT